MVLQLTARTPAGARFVALAETLAGEVAECAGVYDRESRYPFKSFETLKRSGYFVAPLPERMGGMDVTSVHDVLVAQSRLARGDASLAIGVNMHFAYLMNVVRRWQIAVAAGDGRRADALEQSLEEIARDGLVFAAAGSEPRQDLTRPATTATRTEEGWIVSGRKVFCTMSPAADVLYTAVAFTGADGRELYGYAMVPRATPGVVVHDDWDALGMRASGSHSVSFDGVRLPAAALRGGFPLGDAVEYIERNLGAGLFHAATALGIAESAHGLALAQISAPDRELDARTRMLAAENVVDLSACRAVLSRAAALIDDQQARNPASRPDRAALTSLFAEAQAAKSFLGEAGVRIVDRALALTGGAGYLNGSPLARAYRDVRATSFMHPLGANRAYEWLAGLALGREPSLH
jgi:alkylation response protein AidB-like acyl-CoA dehydrogenase